LSFGLSVILCARQLTNASTDVDGQGVTGPCRSD